MNPYRQPWLPPIPEPESSVSDLVLVAVIISTVVGMSLSLLSTLICNYILQ